jgi:hypothetical protein
VIKFHLEARDEEVALIQEAARKLGLSVNPFMRETLFGENHMGRRKPSQSAAPALPGKTQVANRAHGRCAS